ARAVPAVPWLVSAASAVALRAQAERLLDYADAQGPDQTAAARALAEGRALLAHRAVVVADTLDGHRGGLAELAGDAAAPGLVTGTADDAGETDFVFPGQGTQWVGMGRR
ncbi:hypothetical protein PUR61_17695, partial [Streptomyces sp. BE20]|uniref:hypothetical protein n=1 Tax=Streptomyces sp. BE20 TaxID=3002525 RepID=UPI002E75C263